MLRAFSGSQALVEWYFDCTFIAARGSKIHDSATGNER